MQGQAEQLSKSRKKFHQTTYKDETNSAYCKWKVKYYTFEHYGPLAAQKCSRGRKWPGSPRLRSKNVLTFMMREEKGRGFWAF